jgi:hypothetical protein
MATISTIPDLVNALGGAVRVAKWAGYEDIRGVKNWIHRGIPPSYHLRIVLEARRRGLIVAPGIFDLSDDDAMDLMNVLNRHPSQQKRRVL